MYARTAQLAALAWPGAAPATLIYRIIPGGYSGDLPAGDAGTVLTLQLMRGLVLQDVPLLRSAASRILGGGTARDRVGALRGWLGRNLKFEHDPAGVELLKAPAYQLERIQDKTDGRGDCDEIATLGAALAIAGGMPARFVVLRFEPGGPFEHVYTEVLTPAGWVELDTSRQLQRVPSNFRAADVATFDVGG